MATNHLHDMIETGKEIIDNGYEGSMTALAERLFDESGIDEPDEDETDDLTAALQAYRSQKR